ncbi:hypothetical protein CHU95_10650 [Niveispirillum lacus]|uniref:GYF domain-containing protein n=1 Tax=Niveispirillum lacus TaxID=1981099 RepID=A0A255YZ54_9PROT|nr:DUF4339 domain-containing protein [Niveispirillum lacus]OYQ34482.1 hypothetical protein CHU95_10650 [Niveispirillum lacus]
MESWWYAQDGKAYGPIQVSDLRYMLEMGDLNAGHWLWAPGMTGWAQAGSVAAFADQLHAARLSLHACDTGSSPAELPNTENPRLARPCSRFWAQALDYQLLKAAVTLLLAVAGYRLEHDGLRLRHQDGTQPSLHCLIHRQKLLWKLGFAFGIPPAVCFTMLDNKLLLERARPVPWDDQTGMNVYQSRPSIGRQWLCALLIMLLIVAPQALASHLLGKPLSLYL